ncbi:MAG: hypothetical protein J6A55_07510 [Oscillospiraceae bacterium]|nr:hypothetical protein [Oscillospiraceae bacterium]
MTSIIVAFLSYFIFQLFRFSFTVGFAVGGVKEGTKFFLSLVATDVLCFMGLIFAVYIVYANTVTKKTAITKRQVLIEAVLFVICESVKLAVAVSGISYGYTVSALTDAILYIAVIVLPQYQLLKSKASINKTMAIAVGGVLLCVLVMLLFEIKADKLSVIDEIRNTRFLMAGSYCLSMIVAMTAVTAAAIISVGELCNRLPTIIVIIIMTLFLAALKVYVFKSGMLTHISLHNATREEKEYHSIKITAIDGAGEEIVVFQYGETPPKIIIYGSDSSRED